MEMKQPLENLAAELERELKDNILPWWMVHTPDHQNGGFVGRVNLQNRPVETAPKGAILNARILWTFSAAFDMFRNGEYLKYASRAYQYILDHFLDPVHGGVFWELDHSGRVLNSKNQIYALAFSVYALAEYFLVSGDRLALERAVGLYELIEKNSLDPERNGYREAFGRDWKSIEDLRLSEKDLNASKTMNTHLHILEAYANLYRAWSCNASASSLENIIRLFIERFVDHRTHHLRLFFDDQWNLQSDLVSFGHDIECSWLLSEAAGLLGTRELVDSANQVSVNLARQGFAGLDKDHGLFYEYFPSKNRFDTDKHWWPQAEAMVGFLNAYQLTGEAIFASKALETWEFIKKYMIDHREGEWFLKVNREGVPYPSDEKAGFWKCPYHNGRACMEIIRRVNEI